VRFNDIERTLTASPLDSRPVLLNSVPDVTLIQQAHGCSTTVYLQARGGVTDSFSGNA
jgi:hypothetical protein